MNRHGILGAMCLVLSTSVGACGSSAPKSVDPPQRPVGEIPVAPPPGNLKAAISSTRPPEDKKKAEAARALEQDRAKMKRDHEADVARFTPELKAQAKTLADASYPTGKAAIQAAVAGKHRRPGHADRDKYRHPVDTLDALGFKPNMTVIEYGPGEGWFTELLAPSLAKNGKLFVTNGDPNGPVDERSTFYAQRVKLLLDTSPELYGKVETITIDSKKPKLDHEGKIDMVLVFRGLHGMVNGGTLQPWLAEMHSALKPNGVLGIEQHRAKADAKPEESAKKGYLPEKWVIEQVEAAGFKLATKSEINANPKDTKDYPEGVWTLPPSYELGDKDKDKYTAIGESDRMTLKFTKVAKKP